MTIFWILAAGLLGLASLFVALPLLKGRSSSDEPGQDELNLEVFRQRLAELDGDLASGFLDQGQYDAARHDLERELLYDLDGKLVVATPPAAASASGAGTRYPLLALALVALVSAGAVLTYLGLGERQMISRIEALAAVTAPHAGSEGGAGAAPLDVLVQGLAERMEKNPENLEGWLMLGRTYFALGQASQARDAMERAYKLAPHEPEVMLAYAQALATSNGNRLEGRPAELIQAALTKDPANPTARWLNGMVAYQQARFAEAAESWQDLVQEMDPASNEAKQLGRLVTEARNRAGLPQVSAAPEPLAQAPAEADPNTQGPQAATTGSAPQAAEDTAGARIQVTVSLDPSVAAQAAPGDAAFIY
ncbi:MAG: c-type cytochrome biogenesis protein CcmI, partial [Chromatiaceae bacterium]